MLSRHLKVTIMLMGLCMLLMTAAVFGKSSSEAAEAKAVTVSWTDVGHAGVAQAEGCEQCPLAVNVSEKTKLIHNGKKIKPRETAALSGKAGTVIYDTETNTALKVVW